VARRRGAQLIIKHVSNKTCLSLSRALFLQPAAGGAGDAVAARQ
jgi:hypothetical protein